MGGQTLARRRRHPTHGRYFTGNGIDVGAGGDSIGDSKDYFPGIVSVKAWDMSDGDGMLLESVADNTYDFLHSSHSLEHMVDVSITMKNWIRVVKPGGYLVIIVPEFEMYEKSIWPSKYNNDHKHYFTMEVVNQLISTLDNVKVISVELLNTGHRPGDTIDQTSEGTCECGIEFILQKL